MRVVFRFDVTTNGDGDTATYYVTTRGFRTKPTDSPANTYIPERVAQGGAGSYTRSMFGGNGMTGAIQSSKGVLKLNNEDGGLDEFAQYASSGGDVVCLLGDDSMAFPSGYFQLYASQIKAVLADFDAITVQQRDRTEAFNNPIVTATFAGTGGLEGTVTAAKKKQLVFGAPGLVSPILLDPLKQIYYLQANATDQATLSGLTEFGHVFGGGVPSSRGNVYVFEQDLLSETDPDPGQYRLWSGYEGSASIGGALFGSVAEANVYCKGPIYFRLGTPPTAELKFGAVGMLQNRLNETPRAWRFSDLCNRAGLSDVSPYTMAPINGQVEDFDVGNRLIDGDQTFMDTMNDRCVAVNGSFGLDRLDRFYCVTLVGPESGADASVFTFDDTNVETFNRQAVAGMERPVWQVNVKSGRTSRSAALEAASTELQDLLSRDGFYVEFSGSSPAVRKAYPNAMSVSLEIDGNDFKTQELQRAFIDHFGSLHGTRRDFVAIKCRRFDTRVLGINLHDKVTLEVNRFSYNAGVLFRVVTITVNLDEPSVSFVLWGNNSGFHPFDLGGGNFPAGAGDPGGSWGGGTPPVGTSTIEEELSVFEDFDIQFFVGSAIAAAGEFEFDDFEVESDTTVGQATDPDFASVALLMHFDGANNSATATDSSSYGDTKTLTSPYVISTAQSKWGGASLLFPNGVFGVTPATWSYSSRYGRGSGQGYTIEAHFWQSTGNPTGGVLGLDDSGSILWLLRPTGGADEWELSIRDATYAATFTATSGAWHFIQTVIATDGTSITKVDGTTVLTTPNLGTWSTAAPFISNEDVFGGSLHVDDWRITPGVARAFAVPTAAFPDS